MTLFRQKGSTEHLHIRLLINCYFFYRDPKKKKKGEKMGRHFLDTYLKGIPFFSPSHASPRFDGADGEAAGTGLDLIIELS